MRILLKSLSWRMVATTVTASLVLIGTGSFKTAFCVGLVDSVIKIGAFMLHEKAWEGGLYVRLWRS